MPRIPNKQLVQELKEGKPIGCRHLIDQYQERLVGESVNVFDLLSEDAEELVSDVLLTVVQKVQDFEFKRGDGDFHLWVMTIFRNRVRDFARHVARTGLLTQQFDESNMEGETVSPEERAVVAEIVRQYQDSLRDESADRGAGADKLRIVAETLEKMESWERVLLRCRALDVPYEDISSYTGKPVKQLKVYHVRVKKKFTRMLTEAHPEFAHEAMNDNET